MSEPNHPDAGITASSFTVSAGENPSPPSGLWGEAPVPARQPFDLMRWRGVLGLVGEAFILAAGLVTRDSKKGMSGFISMSANSLLILYGGQKKQDAKRLDAAKALIRQDLQSAADAGDSADGHASSDVSPLGNANQFIQRNSTRLSDGMKFVANLFFALSGSEHHNSLDKLHGQLALAAKGITFFGKDEDPYSTTKSPLDWLRERTRKGHQGY